MVVLEKLLGAFCVVLKPTAGSLQSKLYETLFVVGSIWYVPNAGNPIVKPLLGSGVPPKMSVKHCPAGHCAGHVLREYRAHVESRALNVSEVLHVYRTRVREKLRKLRVYHAYGEQECRLEETDDNVHTNGSGKRSDCACARRCSPWG